MTEWDAERLTQGNWDTIPFLKRTGVVVDHAERGFVRLRMPFEPNVNHVGMMYAGALFTLAEVPGGTIFITTFDPKRYYPIVKDLKIRFRRPATTDITVEVRISDEEAQRVMDEADANGKADYSWECELKDATGEVVAITQNEYQLRAHDLG
ncbi:MAG: YiiD C-terminal domain-containing protein [Acidimicrobiales bacterium]|nr:YiiD C-terminal domain-containing protein [Acidimicrobiales bacterium]